MKVYVVTEGDYSDYHIVGVCTSKESAERIRQLASSDYHEAQIEEYEADRFNVEPTYKYYYVRVLKDGAVEVSVGSCIYSPYEVYDYRRARGSVTAFVVDVFAQDEEHAKKIAFDCIAKYKAEREGTIVL